MAESSPENKNTVFASGFTLNYENKTVEHLWNFFNSVINQGISKFIPSLPWMTQENKRLVWKRDKLFQHQRKSGKSEDRHNFKQVKHLSKLDMLEHVVASNLAQHLNENMFCLHTCHTSHCEIKSHRFQPI